MLERVLDWRFVNILFLGGDLLDGRDVVCLLLALLVHLLCLLGRRHIERVLGGGHINRDDGVLINLLVPFVKLICLLVLFLLNRLLLLFGDWFGHALLHFWLI